jgi:apolipoprotein N-acyltransferase
MAAAARAADGRSAANLGAAAGIVFYGASLHWLVEVFGWAAVSFWFVFALWLALFTWLFRRLEERRRRGGGFLRDLAFAAAAGAAWTGIEYFRSEVWWIECPWLALGFSQTANLAVLQSMSLWGVYGTSFLLAAVNAAFFLAAGRRWKPALAALVLIGGLGAWGHRRFRAAPAAPGRPVSVALIQDESFDWRRLADLSRGPGARDADLTVWPEYGFLAPPGREEAMRAMIGAALRGRKGVTVAAGAVMPEDGKARMQNFAWVLSPEGELLGRTDKRHPIPFVERRLARRKTSRPIDTPAGRLGVQICYDLDFEDVSRDLARQGAELLVVPNLDPASWKKWQHAQHSAMAAARAAETGLPIVRAASSGTSQVIDPSGEAVQWLSPDDEGVLSGIVHVKPAATFYTRAGWLVGPLCLGLLALWPAAAAAARLRRRTAGRASGLKRRDFI